MISRLGRRSPLRWALPPALAAALLAIGCAPPTTPSATTEPDTPPFVEAAAAAGVSHTYTGDWTYFVVGGVATFDAMPTAMPTFSSPAVPTRPRFSATRPPACSRSSR